MPSIFQYKFLLPPAVAVIFLYFADTVIFAKFLEDHKSVTELLLGTLMIFGAGFLISTVAYATCTNWLIERIVGDRGEVALWTWISDQKDFFSQQVSKRWDMLALNINTIYALLLTLVVTQICCINPTCYWYLSLFLVLGCATTNAFWSYRKMRHIAKSYVVN